MTNTLTKKRIESIDILRGIVMVIMALDHVRDYFHVSANVDDPMNLATTTPILFFTRWITHFCAPIFIFLSGTSIYLQSLRKTKKELSSFLLKRGLWLIFAEVAIITLGWSFNPHYNFLFLQVIWTIGISMVILSLMVRFPSKFTLAIGFLIVVGHNLLDIPESAPGFKSNLLWDLLHHGFFVFHPIIENHSLLILYPFLPWTGLMMLGYCTGVFFSPKYTEEKRRKILIRLGLGLIAAFIVIRLSNIYGDPNPWSYQDNIMLTVFSFLSVHKYPPSLLFMCMTIGPALLFLALLENIRNGFTKLVSVFGRTPFFYYILHIYLIHLIDVAFFFSRGHSLQDAIDIGQRMPFLFIVPGEGYSLTVVYLIWIAVITTLYPLCKWYDAYKTKHKEKWWLSYL